MRWIAAAVLLLVAAYGLLGALQNGSFAVTGLAEGERFYCRAPIWLVVSCVAVATAVLMAGFTLHSRNSNGARTTGRDHADPTHRLYVETDCCTTCGVPWTLAPGVFREGADNCIVARQPSGASELRRVLRVFRTQELNCVRYGGRDSRILRVLQRTGCGDACDHQEL
jgi:hypothetical protein